MLSYEIYLQQRACKKCYKQAKIFLKCMKSTSLAGNCVENICCHVVLLTTSKKKRMSLFHLVTKSYHLFQHV